MARKKNDEKPVELTEEQKQIKWLNEEVNFWKEQAEFYSEMHTWAQQLALKVVESRFGNYMRSKEMFKQTNSHISELASENAALKARIAELEKAFTTPTEKS